VIKKRQTEKSGVRYDVRLRGPDGRERFKMFRTRKDAERYEREQRRAMDRGEWIDPRHATLTFEEYAGRWVKERPNLRPRTIELYESLLRCHILPEFGTLPLGRITPAAVRSWHAGLVEKVQSGSRGTASAVDGCQGVSIAASDPRDGGDRPADRSKLLHGERRRTGELPGASATEPFRSRSPSREDARAMAGRRRPRRMVSASRWRGSRAGTPRRELGSGRGPAAMLHSQRRALCHPRPWRFASRTTKDGGRSANGQIPPHLIPGVQRHLDTFVAADPESPLLTGTEGGRLRPAGLQKAWSAARVAIGRPEIHFHDLRHAGLTWAARQGIPTRELMARAGHASSAAALRYQHATEDGDAAIAEALSRLAETPRLHPVPDGARSIRGVNADSSDDENAEDGIYAGGFVRAGDGNRTRVLSLGSPARVAP
jgi:Phage integrase, N-terminal SAM-like domain/Phage integrase family